MNQLVIKTGITLLVLLIEVTAFHFGRNIPIAEQWPLFEALRTTASIIFAVIGAWLAIIYPERLKLSFQSSENTGGSNTTGIGKLLSPAINATVILSIVLVVGIAIPICKRIDLFLHHIEVSRGASYALLALLTLWQLWTVVLTLIPADIVKSNSDRQANSTKLREGYKSLGRVSREDSNGPD